MKQKRLSSWEASLIELALRRLILSGHLSEIAQSQATRLRDKLEASYQIVLKTA